MDEINLGFVKKIIPKFKIWLDSDNGREFIDDRLVKDIFFENNFSVNNIKKIDDCRPDASVRTAKNKGSLQELAP